MSSSMQVPDVDDLRLVSLLRRTQSLGAAARELMVSQPALSQRLSRIERRCGTVLFTRTTTGSTPTAAGREMARQADHILDHLSGVTSAVRAAAHARTLRVGTFASLSTYLFPTLDDIIGDAVELRQVVHHGRDLIDNVEEGSLDAAVVGVAEQQELPPHVTATQLGTDRLALFLPDGVDAPAGSRPFAGIDVVYTTWDNSGPQIAQKITSRGGRARHAATAAVAVAVARRRGTVALLPASAARRSALNGDRVTHSRIDLPVRLTLITRGDPDPLLTLAVPAIVKALGLHR